MKRTLTVALLAVIGVATAASAQGVVTEEQKIVADQEKIQVMPEKTRRLSVSVEAKPVVGAPYSGEAVTEYVQVLADGNRIVRRTTARIYRDGKGRTRRETIGSDGQVADVILTDPTGRKSYVVDPDTNTAYLNSVFTLVTDKSAAAGAGGGGTVSVFSRSGELTEADKVKLELQTKLKRAASEGEAGNEADKVKIETALKQKQDAVNAMSTTKEDLGQQPIEGVLANGTRTTTVIAAGVIGNEQPISVVSEEWFSPDLKVLVMTRHSDPRTGETIYRLTGINRSEPNPSLFELPNGITVK